VKKFVFDYIDSVEQLEILLLLSQRPGEAWTAETVSREMRSNAHSTELRLRRLQSQDLLTEEPPGHFRFSASDPGILQTIQDLSSVYASRRHRVLELVFAPLKQSRAIAEAFRFSGKKPPKGGTDG